MSRQDVHPDLALQRRVLSERCAALGLPLLRCDADGAGVEAVSDGEALPAQLAAALAHSETLERLIAQAATEWVDEDVPEPREVIAGVWAVPLAETHRRRRAGYLVAISFEGDSEGAARLMQDERRARWLQGAVRTLPHHASSNTPRVALLLNWAHQDCAELAGKDRALGEFCSQMTECYEEINLLYKLGRSMTELNAPDRFVQQACDELAATLSYRWIAAKFTSDRKRSRHLADRCFVSGDCAVPVQSVAGALDRLAARLADNAPQAFAPSEIGASALWPGGAHLLAHPIIEDGSPIGVVVAGQKEGADDEVSSADIKLLDAAVGYLLVFLRNAALYEDQQAMFLGTLEALTASIDAKDRYTCGHSERVAMLAARLARAMGMGDAQAERVRICGLVHDVGKIGVPEHVLGKPGRLTDEEFEVIKLHPEIGHRILRDIPLFEDVLPGVLHHHERWDGRGYPGGLAGEDIPLYGRILALADSFDAMSSTRTYRKAMDRQQVMDQIRDGAGVQFDPDLTQRFLEIDLTEYDRLVSRHLERDSRPLISKGQAA